MSDAAAKTEKVATTIKVERHGAFVGLVTEEPLLARRKRIGAVGREWYDLPPTVALTLGRAIVATATEILNDPTVIAADAELPK